MVPSADFLVSLGGPCKGQTPCAAPRTMQADTLMHELGHNLGLRHGGDEDFNFKPNYLSIMSYMFQMSGLDGPGRKTDYSRFALPGIDESALAESAGLGSAPNGYRTALACPAAVPPKDARRHPTLGGGVDFNCDGAIGDGVTADVNGDGFLGFFRPSWVDWHHLTLDGGEIGGLGDGEVPAAQTTVDEAPLSELEQARDRLVPPPGATTGAATEATPAPRCSPPLSRATTIRRSSASSSGPTRPTAARRRSSRSRRAPARRP